MKDKVALVTGGTKGIGRAAALELARRGCAVAVNYFKSRDSAESAVSEMRALGVRAIACRGNVGREDHVQRVVDAVRREFGVVDYLISNAASGALKPAIDLSAQEFQDAIDMSGRALLSLARAVLPIMPDGGRIVAVTSLGPRRYIEGYAAVASAKAVLETLTRYLAVELAPRGVRANAVCAGFVDTESLRGFPNFAALEREARERTPLGRLARPEDVAPVVAWLCSDESAWMTGQVVVADGGYSLR
jgi:enoyl-[acyl-carrier protein] reductase III